MRKIALLLLQARSAAWYAIVTGSTVAVVTAAFAAQNALTGVTKVATFALASAFTFAYGLVMRLALPLARKDSWHASLYARCCTAVLVAEYAACAIVLVWHLPCPGYACVIRKTADEWAAVREL